MIIALIKCKYIHGPNDDKVWFRGEEKVLLGTGGLMFRACDTKIYKEAKTEVPGIGFFKESLEEIHAMSRPLYCIHSACKPKENPNGTA